MNPSRWRLPRGSRLPRAFSAVLVSAATALAFGAPDPRADFLRLIDRPRVPLAAEADRVTSAEDGEEFRFSYATDSTQRVPGILLKPTGRETRLPVVIALHGTGGSKQSMLPLMHRLAARGFLAVAIDGRYHGERTRSGRGSAEYQDAILRAWHGAPEHPFFFDSVWDVGRLIDYLISRPDVDPDRIGVYGVSKGGIEAYLAAATDLRIAAAVPCIAVESFRWADDHDSWHSRIGTIQSAFDAAAKESGIERPDGAFLHRFYDRVAPGLDGEFDGPAMVPLIAPRPLLTINGDSDPRTPMPGLQECLANVRKAYHQEGADDRLLVRIQEKTGHRVNPDSEQVAVDWFVRWLRPPEISASAGR